MRDTARKLQTAIFRSGPEPANQVLATYARPVQGGLMSFSSAEEVLSFIAEENVEFVDVRFTDLPGTVQHFTVPVSTFDADVFTEGRMFDGSSIRAFQAIDQSDMLLIPDPTTP